MAVSSLAVMAAILLAGFYTDMRWRRIPNWLTFPGMVAGVVFGAVCNGQEGALWALKGIVVGFLVLFPAYLCAGLGAGDVKLLMAAGSFLGFDGTIRAVLWLAGISLMWGVPILIWRRQLKSSLVWTARYMVYLFNKVLLRDLERERPRLEGEFRLPFGPVIALACFVEAVLSLAGWF